MQTIELVKEPPVREQGSPESWRVESGDERALLERLLSQPAARLIIAEFETHGIDTPCLDAGTVFVSRDTGQRHISLPFRASTTGQVHAALDAVDDFVQGVYVPLDEAGWETFTVVMAEGDVVACQTFPWTALRDPGPKALLSALAREKSFVLLQEAQQDICYRALFLKGASSVAILNPDIGYYMTIAVCAV